jgi:2,3-bisphosphoglycerate-independent phosphoglycerate mutase
MKYAIVIPDGCADEPQDSLGGRTPLQAAHKPNMDRVAQMGIVGLTNNVPPSLTPASDVATLSLFGYDPLEVYTGRAPLEAAAMGVSLGPNDWAIRCNLVTIENGEMSDFTAGHIGNDDGKGLMQALNAKLGGPIDPWLVEFHAGVSYRNLAVIRGKGPAPFAADTKTQAPHDIPDQPISNHLPQGPGATLLREWMQRSREILGDHPINLARVTNGQRPANQIWLWGQGKAPHLRPFVEIHGVQGAIISAVDLVRGVGMLLGWTRIDVPGATGYLDTDYAAKGRHAVAALAEHDLVCVHIEAPDEASHEGRTDAKVKAIEEIDRHIVGPLLEALPSFGEWRLLICPDHRTLLRTRAHAHGAVPFSIAGAGVVSSGCEKYNESVASLGKVTYVRGCELLQSFLNSAELTRQ